MYKNILVPTDGSPLSRAAAEKAVKLAKRTGAKITAFFAAPAPTPMIYKGLLPVGFGTTTEHKALAEKAAAQHLQYVEKTGEQGGRAFRGFNLGVQPPVVAWFKELPRRRIPHEAF